MKHTWLAHGVCGTKATILILCLLCSTAVARSIAGGQNGNDAILRSSDHYETEPPENEGSKDNENMWTRHRRDYNRETPVIWLKESGMPVTVEFLIAFLWIGMVASMPLIVMVLEGGHITRIQMIIFTVMWLVLAAGVFLFNKVLLFQSSHFLSHRSLTLVECVYLMAQIITTVGYGDITPAHKEGQVVVAIYVMFALLIIANVASEAAAVIETRTMEFAAKLKKQMQASVMLEIGAHPEDSASPNEDAADKSHQKSRQWHKAVELPPLPLARLLRSFFMYVFFCMMGCIFYVNYPGENKTLLDGVYMSVITLSTVGFGAVTPATEGGKVFGCFWMFFGSAALFKLVGDFMETVVIMKQREMYNAEEDLQNAIDRINQLPNSLTSADFLKFSLVHRGLMKQTMVDAIGIAFSRLNPAADGTISREDARRFLDMTELLEKSPRG